MMAKSIELHELTEPQKRIWVTQIMHERSCLYTLGGCVECNGDIDLTRLEMVILRFVNERDAFRLRFVERDNTPMQYFSTDLLRNVQIYDFRTAPNAEELFSTWSSQWFSNAFSLIDKPLYSFALFRIDEKRCGYMVKIHHLIADGWSFQILQKTIAMYYDLPIDASIQEISEYKKCFATERQYMHSKQYLKDQEYWKNALLECPNYLMDDSEHTRAYRYTLFLSDEMSSAIQDFCSEHHISLMSLFISIYAIYLNKISFENDLILGIPVLGRSGHKERNTFGMFVNIVPLRIQLEEEMAICDLLTYVHSSSMDVLRHQKYPYNHIVKDLQGNRHTGSMRLFSSYINYYGTTMESNMGGNILTSREYFNGEQEYDIQIIIREWEKQGCIQLDVDYREDKYDQNKIRDLTERIELIIGEVLERPKEPISKVHILNERERMAFIGDYYRTDQCNLDDLTIPELFERQNLLTPHNVAVYYKGKFLTYSQLNERAELLAEQLREKGVKVNCIVGLLANHSAELIIAIMAIMKAGGAYLPIDPLYPTDRIKYMLEDANVSLVVTENSIDSSILNDLGVEFIFVNNTPADVTGICTNKKDTRSSKDLAYVIYTSGSTGKPKGVMIRHDGLVNYTRWACSTYFTGSQEVLPLYSSISFDLTVTSVFAPLISGNAIAVYQDDQQEYMLNRIVKDNLCTILKLTPAHLSIIKDMDNTHSNIHTLIVGGENLTCRLAEQTHRSFNGKVTIYNEYGPTEATVGCIVHKYNPEINNSGSVPIGVPIDHMQTFILDKSMNPLPLLTEGPLYLSGIGLAIGYINRPDLTAERFIHNPYGKLPLYNTGDIARFTHFQEMEYLSRKDHLLKINGFRIETQEIEVMMAQYPLIHDVVVIGEKGDNGFTRLVAYYTSQEEIQEIAISHFLSEKLPSYMIPQLFQRLQAIPLSTNGKVDKKALPKINMQKRMEGIEISERNEKLLLDIVEVVLGTEGLGLNDHFICMGGDSIKAIQVSSKLLERGYKLQVKDILGNPVFYDMAQKMTDLSKQQEEEKLYCGPVSMPMTQWFFAQEFTDPHNYGQFVQLEMSNNPRVEMIKETMFALVNHHQALRMQGDFTSRMLYSAHDAVELENIGINEYDISTSSEECRMSQLQRIQCDTQLGTSVGSGLLINASIVRTGDCSVLLMIVIHHLVVDGISWLIFLQDMDMAISQLRADGQISLPPAPQKLQQRCMELETFRIRMGWQERTFWLNAVNTNMIQLPQGVGSSNITTFNRTLKAEIVRELMYKANTPFNTQTGELIVSALFLALRSISHDTELVIEFESHGRNTLSESIDISRTIGWFTSIYPLIVSLSSDDTEEGIIAVKEAMRNIPNGGIGYGLIHSAEDRVERGKKSIRFNYLGQIATKYANFNLLECGPTESSKNSSTAALEMNCMILDEVMHIQARFDAFTVHDTFVDDILNRMQQRIVEIVNICLAKTEVCYTPSDFSMSSLSQEDLNHLFS